MLFQLMFAIITPALICGGYAERMKFSSMCVFSSLWLLFVYCPLAHMMWGENGYFNWSTPAFVKSSAFDFAGGTVVHISSGIAALMCALFLGKRKGYDQGREIKPHNLAMSFTGAALLWVGWFGFNAGSALQANGLAVMAFANTHFATAAAALSWPAAEWFMKGKPTMLGSISGAVAGLVAVTPASGFVTPMGAITLGLVVGVLCMVTSSYMKKALGFYDDSLDAFGVHAIGGMWGAISTGIFINADTNPNIAAAAPDLYNAIVAGQVSLVWGQAKAVLNAVALSAIGSSIILAIVKGTMGLRPTLEQEEEGLDITQHGEEAYAHSA
jgi:Amt family ammonium transporter